MPIDALSVLCAQLTCDLSAIAKFLFRHGICIEIWLRGHSRCRSKAWCFLLFCKSLKIVQGHAKLHPCMFLLHVVVHCRLKCVSVLSR